MPDLSILDELSRLLLAAPVAPDAIPPEVLAEAATEPDPVAVQVNLWALRVLGAAAILILGLVVAKWLSRLTAGRLKKVQRVDPTVRVLAAKSVYVGVVVLTVIATLHQFGVPTTSLVAAVGAAGLAIGLALQGTLSNVASGVMLLILRPFQCEHAINVGGRVYIIDDIGLFVTTAHEPDGPRVTIPNSKLWGSEITNYSVTHNDQRRVNETVGIAYSDDIGKAIAIIKELIEADERFLKDPAPDIGVAALGESSVDIFVRAWCQRADWWPTKCDFTRKVKEAFDAGGICIPFPQRDVHLFSESGPKAG